MAPSAGFWKGFKKTLLVLILLGIVASVLFFVFIPNAKGMLLGGGTLLLVINLALILIFIQTNDEQRPETRKRSGEQKRFDFHRH